MRLPKRYIKRVVKKRLIEFILIFSVISIVSFGGFMVRKEARSGTGILYQYGDDWYIDLNYRINNSYCCMFLRIRNPDSFPHVLIPENNGTEVHYLLVDLYPGLAIFSPRLVNVIALDLVSVFIIKQAILNICIVIFSIAVFPFLCLIRKKFPITNKLFG